jgi:hypothetical protein
LGTFSRVASRFDPFGIVTVTEQTVRAYIGIARWSERQFHEHFTSLMNGVAPQPEESPSSAPDEDLEEGLDTKMHRLLDRAVEQSTASSRHELFHMIVDQLVPDEARIVGALSDGSVSPLLNVYARTRTGLVGEVVLENMSLIAKTANLALPQMTPMYVSHLLALGLVETGEEDTSLKDEYEILAADIAVLEAMKKAARGPIPARVEKHTLRLSGLGLELWAAASGPREEG